MDINIDSKHSLDLEVSDPTPLKAEATPKLHSVAQGLIQVHCGYLWEHGAFLQCVLDSITIVWLNHIFTHRDDMFIFQASALQILAYSETVLLW